MKTLFLFILLLPVACFGLGADSEEFVGISSNNEMISIVFMSDPAEWTGNNWIYGSSDKSKFKFCWINEMPIDKNNPQFSSRISTHFVCASKRGEKPTVFYKRGTRSDAMYEEAMAIYKRTGNCEIELIDFFVCEKGCDENMPRFLFEVGHDGGC